MCCQRMHLFDFFCFFICRCVYHRLPLVVLVYRQLLCSMCSNYVSCCWRLSWPLGRAGGRSWVVNRMEGGTFFRETSRGRAPGQSKRHPHLDLLRLSHLSLGLLRLRGSLDGRLRPTGLARGHGARAVRFNGDLQLCSGQDATEPWTSQVGSNSGASWTGGRGHSGPIDPVLHRFGWSMGGALVKYSR